MTCITIEEATVFMDLDQEKILAIIGIFAAVVFWIGFPIYMQKYHGYSALNVAFAVVVCYWLISQLYKRVR